MTQTDPTDHALAAIASILDGKEASASQIADAEPARSHEHETVTVVAERVTVTIEQETVIAEIDAPTTAPEPDAETLQHAAIEPAEVDGYTRLGPGPLDAIRFRWTARRDDDGQYFVDETIGSHSRPISSGPMPRGDVIAFINGRESAARERFLALKRQMTISRDVPQPEAVSEG